MSMCTAMPVGAIRAMDAIVTGGTTRTLLLHGSEDPQLFARSEAKGSSLAHWNAAVQLES